MKNQILFVISVLTLLSTLVFFSCNNEEEINPDIVPAQEFATIKQATTLANADSISKTVLKYQNFGTRFMLDNNRRQIAKSIQKQFESYGFSAVLDSFYLVSKYDNKTYNTWQYNVIATLTGKMYTDSMYVVGAHYDCILDNDDPFVSAPGANDNASGVAALLETARIFKKSNFEPNISIQFVAFAAEELDMEGSYQYIQRIKKTNAKIKLMLNLDMVAYETATNVSDFTLNLMYYENSESWRNYVHAVALTYSSLKIVSDNKYNKEGDSYNFYDNGYKALFFISNAYDKNYHTLKDVHAQLNFQYCKEIVKLATATIMYYN